MSKEICEQIGEKRYSKACDRLNESHLQDRVERWIDGKTAILKKDVADILELKGKCEKKKTYFLT